MDLKRQPDVTNVDGHAPRQAGFGLEPGHQLSVGVGVPDTPAANEDDDQALWHLAYPLFYRSCLCRTGGPKRRDGEFRQVNVPILRHPAWCRLSRERKCVRGLAHHRSQGASARRRRSR